MRTTLLPLFLAALLVNPTTGVTQETDTSSDDSTTQAPANDAASDLDLGEPVGPQPGQSYIREEFGDWTVRCVRAPEGQTDGCNMFQLLLDENGSAVSEVSIFPLPPGAQAAAGSNIVVPLETLLTQRLTFSVDGGQARQYDFTFCNSAGCVARVGFRPEEITQLKNGNAARLRLVPAAAPDNEVILTMSLTGFTAAFNSIEPVE